MPGLRIMIDHLAFVKVTGGLPDPAWSAFMENFAGDCPMSSARCRDSQNRRGSSRHR